jgi:SSS family solute:Na+ symporter
MVSRVAVLVLSVFTYLLAVSVRGILQTLLIGLTLTTAYTLVTLATLFWPKICRRSHAVWTLLMAMIALAAWLVIPGIPAYFARLHMPHPIYFCWIVSLFTFILVAVFDKKRIKAPSS